jgi:hypothetical protein
MRPAGIQLALALQRHHVVAAADVLLADEDLREGGAARAVHHLLAQRGIHARLDLGEVGALVVEQLQGPGAVAAERTGVDGDLGHGESVTEVVSVLI